MRRRRQLGVACLLVSMVIVAAGMLAGVTTASAQEVGRVDVEMSLEGLQVGVPRSATYPLDVPVRAVIDDARFVRLTGIAEQIDWTLELCATGGCRTIGPSSIGSTVAAGAYEIRVTAVLTTPAQGVGDALGVVRLVSTDELANTGTPYLAATALAASAVALIGLFLLVAARRHDAERDDPPRGATAGSSNVRGEDAP